MYEIKIKDNDGGILYFKKFESLNIKRVTDYLDDQNPANKNQSDDPDDYEFTDKEPTN